LSQPKLKAGVPPAAGVACSLTVTAVAVTPVAQAFTVQRTCWPRSPLACPAVTSTQRLAGAAVGVVLGDVAGSAGVDGAVVVGGSVVGGFVVVVWSGPVVAGVAAGEVSVAVGVVPVGLAVAEADGLKVAGVAVDLAGVAVGVGVVDGDVAVGVADGLGDAAGSCSGSQDCIAAGAAPVVAEPVVAADAAAKLTPETAVNTTLPATRATAAGRGCANRMKTPADAVATARNGSLDYASPYPIGSGHHSLRPGSRTFLGSDWGTPGRRFRHK
jgi:hypothetical protein